MITLTKPGTGGNSYRIPEGRQRLTITAIESEEDFIDITYQHDNGADKRERYFIVDQEGEENTKVLGLVSLIIRMAMRDPSLEGEFDEQEAIGRTIYCDVEHVDGKINPKTKRPYNNYNFTNFGEDQEPLEKTIPRTRPRRGKSLV